MTWINVSSGLAGQAATMTCHLEQNLLTDLYERSMLEAYAAHGMAETAVFELFVR